MHRFKSLSLISLVLILNACGDPAPPLANGDPAPLFNLPRLGGGQQGLPQTNRVVAVRFWADWCPFCESEMQAIEPVYQQLQDRGLVILAVNVRQDQDTAKAFMDKLNVNYDVLLDQEGTVARSYGVTGLPTTVFIDRNGRLAGKILGESTPQVFTGMLEKLL